MLYINPLSTKALVLAALVAVAAPAPGRDFSATAGTTSILWQLAASEQLGMAGVDDVQHDFGVESGAIVAHRLGGLKLRFGVLTSRLSQAWESQDSYPGAAGQPEANVGLFEVSRSFGHAALAVSMSQTREPNVYPGSWSTSALSLGSHASTSALQVAGTYMIAPKLAIAGQAAYGITPASHSSDNLATDISKARTNAFSLALVAADRVTRGDRLSLSVSQPMRTYSGRIVMDMLSRSSGSGAARERLVFSMVPIGREMRAQLNYQMPAGYGATFGLTLTARRNPNNLADASVETRIGMRYVKAF